MADEASAEQGFNDTELADIMDEIEDLEKEFTQNQEQLSTAKKEIQSGEGEGVRPEAKEDSPPEDLEKLPDAGVEDIENVADATHNEVEAEKESATVEENSDKTNVVVETSVEELPTNEAKENFEELAITAPKAEIKTVAQEAADSALQCSEGVSNSSKPSQTATSSGGDNGMEFQIQGDMILNVKFNINGQSITLNVNPEEGLVIKLGNGAQFTLPVK